MWRQVRVARLGEVAIRGAPQEARVSRRIEPAVHLRRRRDLNGLLRLRLLLLRMLVIPSRSAATPTSMPPSVAAVLEATAAATAAFRTTIPAIAPISPV